MTVHQHRYRVEVEWSGNLGSGTRRYRDYSRAHDIRIAGKPLISGSSDVAFRGDADRHNPEDLLLAALSSCHLMAYLHLACEAGIVVTAYTDGAEAMMETESGQGRFIEVVLRPLVTVTAGADLEQAQALHNDAHHACFIANSVNFPVYCEPQITAESSVESLE